MKILASIAIVSLAIALSCGCVETGTRSTSVGIPIVGSVNIVEHSYLFGENTYDVSLSVMGSFVSRTGISKSEMDAMLRLFGSSATQSPTPTPTIYKPKMVAVTAKQSGSDIIVTWQGGLDQNSVSYIDINGKSFNNPRVGDSYTGYNRGTSGRDRVIVTAFFTDGSSAVVIDTYV